MSLTNVHIKKNRFQNYMCFKIAGKKFKLIKLKFGIYYIVMKNYLDFYYSSIINL